MVSPISHNWKETSSGASLPSYSPSERKAPSIYGCGLQSKSCSTALLWGEGRRLRLEKQCLLFLDPWKFVIELSAMSSLSCAGLCSLQVLLLLLWPCRHLHGAPQSGGGVSFLLHCRDPCYSKGKHQTS